MNTPSRNAKLLLALSKQSKEAGCDRAAEQLKDCAFQLEVFELVGLKLELKNNPMVREAIKLVQQNVTSDSITTDAQLEAILESRSPSSSDFNVSRN